MDYATNQKQFDNEMKALSIGVYKGQEKYVPKDWIMISESDNRSGFQGKAFFKNGWNVFDFIIVAVSSVPYASSLIVLRTFRIFRLFKFLDHFPSLDNLVDTFIKLLPNFLSLLAVEAVIFYSFAVIGVSLYGDVFKDFATLGSTLFVLMQAFTLDGWAASIARPVMMVFPDAWLYFTSFILLSFLILVSFLMNAITTVMDHLKK